MLMLINEDGVTFFVRHDQILTSHFTETQRGGAGCADIVEIKHIMLPPSTREFKDIFVVFELMETDLHQARPPPCATQSGRSPACSPLIQALSPG